MSSESKQFCRLDVILFLRLSIDWSTLKRCLIRWKIGSLYANLNRKRPLYQHQDSYLELSNKISKEWDVRWQSRQENEASLTKLHLGLIFFTLCQTNRLFSSWPSWWKISAWMQRPWKSFGRHFKTLSTSSRASFGLCRINWNLALEKRQSFLTL